MGGMYCKCASGNRDRLTNAKAVELQEIPCARSKREYNNEAADAH